MVSQFGPVVWVKAGSVHELLDVREIFCVSVPLIWFMLHVIQKFNMTETQTKLEKKFNLMWLQTFVLSLGSFSTLTVLYQVILSQRGVHWTGNFRFFLNEHDSEQRGDGPLAAPRSAPANSTIWIDSSPHPACPLNRKLMNLIRSVRWNSHPEIPTSLPTTWSLRFIRRVLTHTQR